jgi:hypothetical protein
MLTNGDRKTNNFGKLVRQKVGLCWADGPNGRSVRNLSNEPEASAHLRSQLYM